MNETAAWPGAIPDVESAPKASLARLVLFVSMVLLLLGVSICSWIYFSRFGHLAFWVIAATALSGRRETFVVEDRHLI